MSAVEFHSRAGASLGLVMLLALAGGTPAGAGEALAAVAPQDYYTRRAAKILKRDANIDASAQHPLAAAYPSHSVVVCEAGCSEDAQAEVVFMEQRTDAEPNIPASGGTSAGKPPALKQTATIDCVGGCYDTPRRYQAMQVPGAEPTRPETRPKLKRDPFDPRY